MEQENKNNNDEQKQQQQQEENEFNEEQWKIQWQAAQDRVAKKKQEELQKSNLEKGPSAMIIEGDPVEQPEIDSLPIFTYKDLSYFDGTKHPKCYVSVCDIIFDTTGSGYYGPGETYSLLAGNEGSVSLAKMSFESVFLNKYGIIGLKPKELECLQDWYLKFSQKYKMVGRLNPKNEEDMTEQDHKDMELIKTNNYENPCTQQ